VTVNHFELFGLKPTVDLDVPQLEAKYRALSLQHHPDRVPPPQRLHAVQMTASLNEAVKVLKDPVRRAFYLLKLEGVDLEREDGPARQSMPVDFLEAILEQREQLELAKEQKDLAKARALGNEIGRRSAEALQEGQAALEAGDIKRAAAAMARVRYFQRFLEEVEAIEDAA
jgi:molecular chaperone HscB